MTINFPDTFTLYIGNMGKRKRSKNGNTLAAAQHSRELWLDSMIEELLSYLDYAVQRNMEPAEIDDEAANHLTQRYVSSGYRYSSRQVRNKLRWLWNSYGPNNDNSGNPHKIYEQGSKDISWVTEDQMKGIADRTKEIAHNKHVEFLQSPRKTRSASQATNRSTASPSHLGSISARSVTTSRGSRGSTARSHPLRQQHQEPKVQVVIVGAFSTSTASLTAK